MFDAPVPEKSLAVWWLAQAGFVFKTAKGKVVVLDPYLSDAVERLCGFKRLSLSPISAEEVRADLIVFSHEHPDHLDPDAVPIIARNCPACRFAGPSGCIAGLDDAHVPEQSRILLEAGRIYDLGDVTIHTAGADHGDLSSTALCLVLEFDGIRVLCSGDTAFRPALLKPLFENRPDLLLVCINGAFGNMGPLDAARFTETVNPRIAVPCHYGMFAEHGVADPGGFLHACHSLCSHVEAKLLRPGERFLLQKNLAS
jgi:L-ascorbate 6-phosphate lactonase